MNKIFVLVATTLFMSSCYNGQVGDDIRVETVIENDVIEESIGEFEGAYKNVKNTYKKMPEFNTCMTQSANMCISDAVRDDLYIQLDINLCEDFLGEAEKKSCKNNVTSMLALQNNSLETCESLDKIEEKLCKRQVIIQIALKKGDSNVCDQLDGSTLGGEENMIDFCKDKVYFDRAIQSQEGKKCVQIKNEGEKRMCIDEIKMRKELNRITK